MKIGRVKLYGNIYSWNINSARDFSERFEKAVSENDEIALHIHCYGGEVIEGNLIYNLIKNCKKPVDVYVDGIAASMGSIVMMAARKVYMSENAFVMIHAPSGYAEGTAKEMVSVAKLLRTMEGNFKKIYASKTGKTESDVAAWLDGDNWFGAQEALSEKLIDGIVDPVAKNVETLAAAELKNFTAETLYQRYAASLDNQTQITNQMDKKELIARYGLTGVTSESSDADIYKALDKIVEAEKTAREKAESDLKAETDKQITAVVDAAIKEKKITAEQKPQFAEIGKKAGMEALQAALSAVKPQPTITGMLNNGGTPAADRAGWDWDEWQKKDAKGLEALSKSDPETFQALYDAKYKK